jgi:hypothetical protein
VDDSAAERVACQGTGATTSPGSNFWKPSTTMRSPGAIDHLPLLVDDSPGAHLLQDGPVVRAHHIDLAGAGGVALDRLLRNRERVAVGALDDLDADIHAQEQFSLRIGKFATQRDLTGARIHARIRE